VSALEPAHELAGSDAKEDQEEGEERALEQQEERNDAANEERTTLSPRARRACTAWLSGSVAPAIFLGTSACLLDELAKTAFWLLRLG
jgi:hypothetical protein